MILMTRSNNMTERENFCLNAEKVLKQKRQELDELNAQKEKILEKSQTKMSKDIEDEMRQNLKKYSALLRDIEKIQTLILKAKQELL